MQVRKGYLVALLAIAVFASAFQVASDVLWTLKNGVVTSSRPVAIGTTTLPGDVIAAASFQGDKTRRYIEAHATDHTQVVIKGSYTIPFTIGSDTYVLKSDTNVPLSGVTTAGTDYYVYAVSGVTSSNALAFVISPNSTWPSNYTATTSRNIGGFHLLSASVGTIAGHTLTGYRVGDILPASIWDLKHRPRSSPAGMVYSQGANIWVDIYLASGTGAATASVNGGTISDTRTWLDFVDDFGAVKKKLLSDSEFQLIAAGSNEETNIVGSADPVTTGGHTDTAGRRMVSNIGVEDACGVMWQWLTDQSYRYDNDFGMGAAAKTATIYHSAALSGETVYAKFDASGVPYLAATFVTNTADKWVTFGSAYTVQIKHDAAAGTSGYAVHFDEDATQPARLLATVPGLKSVNIPTSNPNAFLQITYSATPATAGVQVTYDSGSDNRLEFTSPTTANGTIDLAVPALAWAYYDLPGSKGSLYRQGANGDVKLLAGGNGNDGTNSGSRARKANNYRWNANPDIGGRGRSEPL